MSSALEERVARLEATVQALETALQLTLVAAAPASKWLDRQLETIKGAP